MGSIGVLRFTSTLLALALVVGTAQRAGSQEPSDAELKRRSDKWLTVKSWSASYSEQYTSNKTWEMRPGVVMTTTVKSTVSGSYTLDSIEIDGAEWYGYGTGSSRMQQVTSMASTEDGHTITITETTNENLSGMIGDPSRNEYGEFWGGSLSIDVYAGTYSVGLGGPEDGGEATLTRVVEGMPTDYSKLKELPPGLREIFGPLGEKAEEWATYDGPLEDAQGMMTGGIFGLLAYPDMDEPTEYPLPKSGMQLKGSYSNETVDKSWSLSPGGRRSPLVLEKAPEDWIPDPEQQKPATIKVTGNGWGGEKVKLRFTMYDMELEPGFCLNSQDRNFDYDLEFEAKGGFKDPEDMLDGWRIETRNRVLNASVNVIPLDWGAWTRIKVEAEVEEDVWSPVFTKAGKGYITVPRDERGGIENRIADAYEKEKHLRAGIKAMDDKEGSRGLGDGLTAYEEYRGWMIGGDGGRHITTNPEDTIDLFVHCESAALKRYIPDGTVVGGELMIHLLDLASDYVDARTRRINPNSYAWKIGAQHGIRLTTENIPDPGVVGWADGTCTSPGTTNYVALDLAELSGKPAPEYQITIIHELMHGCGVPHHGEVNDSMQLSPNVFRITQMDWKSVAHWDGVNAGDVGCTMQYGWGHHYLDASGAVAYDEHGDLIPFQNTDKEIIWNYLCNTKTGSGITENPQLGAAANGNCLNFLRVTDE